MNSFIVPPTFKSFLSIIKVAAKKGGYSEKIADSYLMKYLSLSYPSSKIYLHGAGRVSIYEALRVFKKIKSKKNEVIVTGFTCSAVIDAVMRADLVPIYADISLVSYGRLQTIGHQAWPPTH